MSWPGEKQRHSMSAKGISTKQMPTRGVASKDQELFIEMARIDARLEIALKNSSDSSANLHLAADDMEAISKNKNLSASHRKSLKKMADDLAKFSDVEATNWQKIYNLREAHKEVRRQVLEGTS